MSPAVSLQMLSAVEEIYFLGQASVQEVQEGLQEIELPLVLSWQVDPRNLVLLQVIKEAQPALDIEKSIPVVNKTNVPFIRLKVASPSFE